jgi:hypothetical protein
MATTYPGCEWPIDDACFTTEWDGYDQTIQDRALALASATLRRLTGYRVGGCPITVRPCKRGCAETHGDLGFWSGSQFHPHVSAFGYWVNSCGCTTPDCSCTMLDKITLPAPIGEVVEVKIDGDTVTDFVRYGNTLVATGATVWPACQDLTLADTEVGTFSVRYLNAYPVDSLGAYAAGVLAVEYARACAGNICQLPPGVTTIVRQGVTMEIASGAFPGGITGIREVDTYVALWNPQGIRQQATVWSPDQPTVWH